MKSLLVAGGVAEALSGGVSVAVSAVVTVVG
jgi:hypothetical protein